MPGEFVEGSEMQIVETTNEGLKRAYTLKIPAKEIEARIDALDHLLTGDVGIAVGARGVGRPDDFPRSAAQATTHTSGDRHP